MKRVLVTGYKAAELGIYSLKHPGIEIIKKAIKKQLVVLLDEGLEWVIVSGQWGVELWAAEVVLELKEEYPALRLAVITPFLEQEDNWKEDKQTIYRQLLQRSDYVNSVTRTKYDGPWQFKAKNEFLLRNSDGMILVYDEEKEGSPRFLKEQAFRKARTQNYRVHCITADDLQSMAVEDEPEFEAAGGLDFAEMDDTKPGGW